MAEKIKVAVVGASGYSGEELVRLLLKHPGVELTAITSRSNAGKSIGEVYPRFAKSELKFCNPDVSELTRLAQVAFLALPHGLATEYAIPLLEA
ncbi:MAG: N-acetyl-gamma-glutamyl-phosphate reductase, partial [Lentisphaeria bacterium]|nr:N-acetyl-gamma-glutamyl-phosphate reductase [Lentisphaeria bacterium]